MNKVLASLFLGLTFTLGACASGFQPSRHYAEVTNHLDVGGDVLLYSDLDGDLSAGADALDKLLERMQKTYPEPKLERVKAKRILNQLGLDQIVAFGLSSARDGKAFHNKAFLQYGKERRGVLLFTGAAPRELEVPRQAPADVDVVFESEIKLKSLLSLAETIAYDVAGKKARRIFADLDDKLPGVSLSVREVLSRLDTRLVGVLRVDERRVFSLDDKVTVPGFDALLSVDDLAILFDAYRGLLQGLPNVTSTLDGDMHWLEMEVAVPGAAWLKPVLAKNMKSGRIFLATNKAFVKEFLAEKTGERKALAQAAEWKRATAKFESKANGLSFMSGTFMGKLSRFLRPLGRNDKDVQMGLDVVLELLPQGGMPMAAQQVNLPAGLYYTSYATTSHKSTLFPALAAGPLALAGTMVGAASAFYRHSLGAASRASLGKAGTDESSDSDGEIVGEGDEEGGTKAGDVDRVRVPLGGPFRGAAQPTVSIVELSDFQCPFCSRVKPTLKKLLEQHPADVRIYFRHKPLPFHVDAHLAAQAAMAAHAQGKFWPMHDKLFANQQKLTRADLEAYAQSIGLDMARFKAALEQGSHKQAVDDDIALAGRLGATGTPSYFINGRSLVGAQPFEKFKEMVDDEIARANKLMAKGTPRSKIYDKLMAGAHEWQQPAAKPEVPQKPELSKDVYKVPVGRAPGRGGLAPKVTIIEYSDFQCPFCARVQETLQALAKTYGDDLRLHFKHNPLPFHNRAVEAALAAEAAHEQGKFWPMHDKLFANWQHLGDADLEQYAKEIGLDMAKYKAALSRSERLRSRIKADQVEGERFGVRGTPNFFINGRPLQGAQPLEGFKALIDEEIKKADLKLRQGKSRTALYLELTKGGLPRKAKLEASARFPDSDKTYRADIEGAPVRGAKDALVTIVLFSDYQCPFCKRVEPTLTQLLRTYKGDLRVAWRDMPLSFHNRAKDAAIAARAAGEQGKYWEMHDKLFGGGDGPMHLENADIERYAEELQLDKKAFMAALGRATLAEAVEADAATAAKLGVTGTPGCFINGKFLSGAQSYEKFKDLVDQELKAARRRVAKGTPRAKVYTVIMREAQAEVEKPEQQ